MRIVAWPGAVSGFALLGSFVMILCVIPASVIHGLQFPTSRGLMVRISRPPIITADTPEERIIVTVQCAPPGSPSLSEPILLLNSRPIARADLPAALRTQLAHRAHRIVYIEGEACLEAGAVFRTVDLARGAWPDVSAVLLTPQLKQSLVQ